MLKLIDMKTKCLILFMLMLYVSFINGQDKAKPNMKLEVSASINNHYKFQDIQIGYGLALGSLKEKSPRVRRYLGLEFNKSFNPIASFTDEPDRGLGYSSSVMVGQLYLIDMLIPLYYEFSIIKRKSQFFCDLGGYFSMPIGGHIKGVQTEYYSMRPSVVTNINGKVSGRGNIGSIAGLGMRISNGERDFLTIRLDSRMDLLNVVIGHSTPINNRYVKLSVGYKFRQPF
jgi:hypothetical protein